MITSLVLNMGRESVPAQFSGLSTDEKPDNAPDNSLFFELDTNKIYYCVRGFWGEIGTEVDAPYIVLRKTTINPEDWQWLQITDDRGAWVTKQTYAFEDLGDWSNYDYKCHFITGEDYEVSAHYVNGLIAGTNNISFVVEDNATGITALRKGMIVARLGQENPPENPLEIAVYAYENGSADGGGGKE